MIYVLGYPEFEPPLAERIDAFRLIHEPARTALVPPHVTMMFAVPDARLTSVVARAQEISAQTQAFSIAFGDPGIAFDPFEKKNKIFLHCGDGGAEITGLHERLYAGVLRAERAEGHPFRPHMTIATCGTQAEIEQVNVSELGILPIHGALRALEIVRFADGKLSLIETVQFLG